MSSTPAPASVKGSAGPIQMRTPRSSPPTPSAPRTPSGIKEVSTQLVGEGDLRRLVLNAFRHQRGLHTEGRCPKFSWNLK